MANRVQSRAEFSRSLTAETRSGSVNLYLSGPPQGQRHLLAHLHRDGRRIIFAIASGFGLTLHRQAGISLPGIPRSGGTSVLWGKANDKVRRLGKDHRAIHLGPIGVYIGRDF